MDGQEPPKKPQIVISTHGFDGIMEELRKDLDIGNFLRWQMTSESILATQEQLIARLSALEQQIKEKKEQKEQILSERKKLGPQPIPQILGKPHSNDTRLAQKDSIVEAVKENPTISVNKNQSRISFKLIATSLVTTLVWWLWMYTHQT